jgi:3-dehydroquinate synthetase
VVPHALDRHLALVGFMGAGKSTVGAEVAERLGRRFVDLDAEIERRTGRSVQEHFAAGEPAFRAVEEAIAADVLAAGAPMVVALGGGAVLSEPTRGLLRRHAQTVLLEVEPATAWERVRASDRPLARSEEGFRELFADRAPLYERVADARAQTVDDVVLRAGGVHVGELAGLELPGSGRVALVSDAHVAGIWGADAQLALGARLASTHELPRGEAAKTLVAVAALWEELRLDRTGMLVAVGGGCTTDAGGFAAATYLRGIPWVAVPTTLVGQVDAAIGGKTAIDLPAGKNLVGAFHWPLRTLIDPVLLETLPAEQWRDGLAEVVKTGLLAGEPLWGLPRPELVARCAAFKTAVCLRDPYDRAERKQLNLGHTFAHALEAAAGFGLPHGRAVALGLLAALRLSGLDTAVVEEQLRPERVRVDRERAWAALARDKKAEDGAVRLVLLDRPGKPRVGVELPDADVRAALDDLIAG